MKNIAYYSGSFEVVPQKEFKIICISSCKSLLSNGIIEIKKGEVFLTDEYNFEWGFYNNQMNVRLVKDLEIIGIFERSNFMKPEEYREKVIENILE